MRYAYTVDQTRRLEEDAFATVGDAVLMQRAAHGLSVSAADLLVRTRGRVYGARVLILVGPGNNGGDALYAGQRLARRGCAVTAVQALGKPHEAGLAALRGAGGRFIDGRGASLIMIWPTSTSSSTECSASVAGPGCRMILLPWSPAPPPAASRSWRSTCRPGWTPTPGRLRSGAVRATRTVTFGSHKPCHLIEPAASRAGEIEVVDIGLDPSHTVPALASWEAADVAAQWPIPGPTSDKYARGVVGIDTGSPSYPGAGVLSTFGAVYGGAGMVRYLGTSGSAEIIGRELPNVVFGEGRVQSWLVGSGWGDRSDGDGVIARLLDEGLPLVIDADGLAHLPDRLPGTALLTPHAGELARLLGVERDEVTADPVAAVRRAADETGATVLLKGATQLVATPGTETVDVAVPGPAWTGQAGSGDVLGGLCAAVLAAGVGARTAAVLAASLQAMTAARFPGPIPPQDLARHCAVVIGGFGSSEDARPDDLLDSSTRSGCNPSDAEGSSRRGAAVGRRRGCGFASVSPYIDPATASAVIDLDAFATNIETLRRLVAPAAVMVVVKADAYGHGMVECARVAREAGAEWLGVATPEEALALREAGDTGRLLAWLYGPDTDLTPLVATDVDISAQSPEQIARISVAAGIAERRARVQLKIDTGLSRNGATAAAWPEVCRAARHAEQVGALDVVSVWSHFAAADEPGAGVGRRAAGSVRGRLSPGLRRPG